jgi:hypothetical protein
MEVSSKDNAGGWMPGVVDQAIQPAELGDSLFDCCFDLLVPAHVALKIDRPARSGFAEFFRERFAGFLAAGKNRHQPAFRAKHPRAAFADAFAASGHDHDSIFETHDSGFS